MRKLVVWFFFCVLCCGTGGIFTVNATPRLVQVGRAYQFDGVDDTVVFDRTDIDFSGATYLDFEVDMSKQSGEFTSIGQVVDGSDRVEMSWYTNDRIYFVLANGSNTLGNVSVTDFGKHTFRFLFDGSGATNADRCKIFVDGIEKTLSFSGTIPSSLPTFTSDFKFGYSASGYSNGKIGNVKQYDENGKLLHSWHGDEGSGVRSFDAVQEWYGSELNVGNDFTPFSASGWTKHSNINGDIELQSNTGTGSYTGLKSDITCGEADNKPFRVKATVVVDSIDTGYINLYLGAVGGGYTETSDRYRISNTGTFHIDEIMVKDGYIGSHPELLLELSTSTEATTTAAYTISDISIQEIHSPAHGIITNANEATFHAEDRDFTSYQNTLGYVEEVPQEELYDLSVASVLGGSSTTTYTNGIRRITGNNTAVTGSTRTNGVLQNQLDLRTYTIDYEARSNATTKITADLIDDWPAIGDRPSVTADFVRYEYEIEAQHTNSGLDFVDWNVEKVGGGNLLATDYGEIQNVSIREISLLGQLIPRAIDEDENPLFTDVFGNYMDGSRRASVAASELYLDTPVAVFDGVDDYVTIGDLNGEALSGMVRFYSPTVINKSTPYKPLLNFGTDASSFLHLGALTGTLTDEIIVLGGWGTNCSYWASSTEEISVGWHTLLWAWDGVKNKLYLDGIAIMTGVAATPAIINPINFNIGTFYNGYAHFGGALSEVRLYNRELSATEILNLHNGNSITSGLIAQYNFSEGGGDTVYDKVPAYLGPELIVNGDFSNGLTGWSYTNATATIQSGNLYAVGTGTIPVNQTVSNAVVVEEGKLYEVQFEIIDTQTSANAGIIVAGGNDFLERGVHYYYPNTSGIHTLHFRAVGTASIALSLHVGTNVGSTAIFGPLSVKEVYEPVHGTITNADLSTFWTNDDTSRSDNLLDGFSKGLYCSSTGTAYKQSNAAYGTWEFDFQYDSNILFIPFISSTNDISIGDGYDFSISGDRWFLHKYNNGIGNRTALAYDNTNTSGFETDNWYKIKITRNSKIDEFVSGAIGRFAVYAKGGSFGDDYVLLSVTSGTNPVTDDTYTTSNYFVADLDAGDKISNLEINGAPVDVHTFTNGTGGYSKVNIPAQSGNTGKDVFKNLLAQPTTVNSVVNRLRLSALSLVTVGRRYWDTSYKKFFLGDTESSFVEFPASNYVVPQTTLNTLDTNKTAVPGRLYYDTTERAFKKGAADGSVVDY